MFFLQPTRPTCWQAIDNPSEIKSFGMGLSFLPASRDLRALRKGRKNVKMTVRFLFFYQLCLSFNFSAQLSKWCNTAQKQLYIHFPSVLKYNSPRTALFAQPYILWKCNVHHDYIPQTSKLIHTALTCSNVFCWLNTLKVATATRRTAWWESLQAVGESCLEHLHWEVLHPLRQTQPG